MTENKLVKAILHSSDFEEVQGLVQYAKFHGQLDLPEGKDGRTPFMCACKRQWGAVQDLLLKSVTNPESRDAHGDSNLIYAIRDGAHIPSIRVLVQKGGPKLVNLEGVGGVTPFMHACKKKWTRVQRLLLENDAVSPIAHDKLKASNLVYAIRDGDDLLTITMLLDFQNAARLVNYAPLNGITAFMHACKRQWSEAQMALLEAFVDPFAHDAAGDTNFIYAVRDGNDYEAVEMLLQQAVSKANEAVNKAGKAGLTPFMHACKRQLGDVEGLLLRHDVDPFARDAFGDSSLIYAICFSSNYEVVKVLVQKGGARLVNEAGSAGMSPFMHACRRHWQAVQLLLLSYGADPFATDAHGDSNMVYAVRDGAHLPPVRVLATKGGAKLVEKAGSEGWTPYLHAVHAGNLAIQKVLLQAETLKAEADAAEAAAEAERQRQAAAIAAAEAERRRQIAAAEAARAAAEAERLRQIAEAEAARAAAEAEAAED